MNYIIYKTTNLITSEIYIGSHITSTLDDGYLGSGNLLTENVKKYGRKNFKKEILFIFNNFADMNNKEKELVNREFVLSKNTLNLQEGGRGRWVTNRTVVIFDADRDKWLRIPTEKFDSRVHITPTSGNIRVIDTLMNNAIRRVPVKVYKNNKRRFKTASSGKVSVRFLSTGETASIPLKDFDRTIHRKVLGGIVVEKNGKKQYVDRCEFDAKGLSGIHKNKVTVLDLETGIKKHVTKEEYTENQQKYKTNTSGMMTAVNKDTGENEYMSVKRFLENKQQFAGATVGQLTVWDISKAEFRNIKKDEFNREYHRLAQDKRIICTSLTGEILIDFWGSKKDFIKLYSISLYNAAKNELKYFNSVHTKKYAKYIGSNFKLVDWKKDEQYKK